MKNTRTKFLFRFLTFLGIAFTGFACHDEIESDPRYVQDTVKAAIYASMHEWYFWNAELPQNLDLKPYTSYNQLLQDLKYERLDRWSYLTTPEDFDRAFTGQNSGHGFGWGMNQDEELFITFVYADSPAGKDGWQRGWKVTHINGKPIADYKTASGYDFQLGPAESGISNTFTFQLPDGSSTTRTSIKSTYQSNSVLFQTVFEIEGKKVGYLVYNSFKATAGLKPTQSTEVTEAMDFLEAESIDELIIDLRYNGGGSVSVAEQLMNRIVPSAGDGKTMYTNTHNRNKEDMDEGTPFTKKGTIELGRVCFITSRSSASASELTINCLTPYMEVVLIGQNTYGKPVGAFPVSAYNSQLKRHNIELVPITFSTANAEGKAAYFDGFPVDHIAPDGISYGWGDPGEPRLNAALHYIQTGSFPASGRIDPNALPAYNMIDDFEGLGQEFPVY